MPDAPSDEAFPLDKGVAVAIGPIISRKHAKECIKLADEENIPYQIDPEAGDTGTEAAVHAVAREGIPVILLSVPSKYMHTTVEMVSVNDVVSTGRLAARYIAGRSKE
jgi:endoglucanase